MEIKPEMQPEETPPFREYANNAFFDPTIWDLTITFGQLGVRLPENSAAGMDWGTAVTLPWGQAKLTAYYFLANLIIHESQNGEVMIPSRLLPSSPPPPLSAPGENLSLQESAKYERLRRLQELVFGSTLVDP
jgi:hypothetical protein